MEKELKNLLLDYEQKLSNCETLLSNLEYNKKKFKHNESGYYLLEEEIKIKNAEYKAYIQIVIDLENLLKHLNR